MLTTRRLAVLVTMLTLLIGLMPARGAADVYVPGAYGLPDLGWSQINPRPISETLLSVAYGAGRWVAVSEHNIYTSADGEQWRRTAPFQSQQMHLVQATYTGDRFLVTNGVDGWTSADGETWTPVTGLTSLAAGLGGCAAVIKERLMFAADCEAWAQTGLSKPYQRVGYGAGQFFAFGGYDGYFYVSPDGAVWTRIDQRTRDGELAYADDPRLIILDDGAVITSTDGGATWARPQGGLGEASGAAAGGDGFLVLQWNGRVMTSADGVTWRELARLRDAGWYGLAGGPDGFVAVGAAGAIARSADGVSWQTVRQGPTFDWISVAYGAGRFLALGHAAEGALLYRSENGLDWEYVRWIPAPNVVLAVSFLGGLFVVYVDRQIGPSQRTPLVLLTSADGVEWSEPTQPLGSAEVISQTGALLAVTKDGLLVKKEGEPTQTVTLPPGITIKGGALTDDGRYILAGNDGQVATSADGQTWSISRVPKYCNLGGLAAGEGRFVTHCSPGEFFTSADGVSWELIPDVRGYRVDYTGGSFFAISEEKVAISADGKTWAQKHQPGLWALAYGDGRYVGVGRLGLVLASDGAVATGVAVEIGGAKVPDPGRSTVRADAQVSVEQPILITVSLVDETGSAVGAGRPVWLSDPFWRYLAQVRLTDASGRAQFVPLFVPEGAGVTFQVQDVLSGQWLNDSVKLTRQKCGSRFPDVSAEDDLCEAVESVAARGLMSGYPDGTFRGQEVLTRAQLAKMAVLAAGQTPLPGEASPFSDTEGHWATQDGYVQAAAVLGLMEGDGNGQFRPDAPVTRAELIKVIAAMAGFRPQYMPMVVWYQPWVDAAYEYRLMGSAWARVYPKSEPLNPNQPATRLEAAAMLANLHHITCIALWN